MELIWSVLTMVLVTCNGFNSLIAIRFFIGLAEATFYPAIQYVIGSWYKPEELAKRACLFHTASAIGPMFSGFLQAGAYNGLNGVHSLPGWKWLFIVDGIITVPIALLGFLIMPDLPSNTRPNVIYTKRQVEIGKKRMEDVGRQPPAEFTKKKVLGFFTTWHIWFLTPLYILFNNGMGPTTSMIFWLGSFNTSGHQVYSVGQINTYPLGIQTVQIITTIGYAYWSDALRLRWPPILLAGTVNIIVSTVLAVTPLYDNVSRRWGFYYLTGALGGISGLIMAWVNELTGYDNEKRAFIVASCNTFAYVFQAWLPIVIFPQVEQPRVFKGNVATVGISFAMICFALAMLYLQKRDEREGGKHPTGTEDNSNDRGSVAVKTSGSEKRGDQDDIY